jgi:hypothetical protein
VGECKDKLEETTGILCLSSSKGMQRENGDCNIPIASKDNPKLANVGQNQRRGRASFQITRRAKLDELGFIWEESDLVKNDQQWFEMLERLEKFQRIHGHCRVP